MKVKHLKKILDKLDPETEIVLSSDPEGNSYGPACGFAEGWYEGRGPQHEKLSYRGEFYDEKPSDNAAKVLCLWPM